MLNFQQGAEHHEVMTGIVCRLSDGFHYARRFRRPMPAEPAEPVQPAEPAAVAALRVPAATLALGVATAAGPASCSDRDGLETCPDGMLLVFGIGRSRFLWDGP